MLLGNLPWGTTSRVGIATIFLEQEGYNNGKLGCVAEARRLLGHERMRDHLPIVAMRAGEDGAPCGTVVSVTRLATGARALGIVLDTGGWGCRLSSGVRVLRGIGQCEGKRISLVDLSASLAATLGCDGWDRVRVAWSARRRRGR